EHFLGFDLREPNLIFVVLVGATTWAQSKTTITVATTDQARAQQQMMTILLPLMFAFFALQFPSGVSLYWVVNSTVGVAFNILTYGFPALKIEPIIKVRAPVPSSSPAEPDASPAAAVTSSRELRTANGPGRSKRQNRRRRP
ncbi:MAG TPA: YidC/Oxa1 family membrane protein insertase, partial [Tepidiformaceae bacterium]|nr:YidC/Oxa1 family membrane protein insertase [Tepidiformaceae bacterium]